MKAEEKAVEGVGATRLVRCFSFSAEERHAEFMAVWNDTNAKLKRAVGFGRVAVIVGGIALALSTLSGVVRLCQDTHRNDPTTSHPSRVDSILPQPASPRNAYPLHGISADLPEPVEPSRLPPVDYRRSSDASKPDESQVPVAPSSGPATGL